MTQSKCWGVGEAAGHRGGTYQPQWKAGVWLLLVILILKLYVWVKGEKRIYFDNIIQKASTPISKTNGRTSQSKFSNWSASPLELCCRVNSCILFPSTHVLSQHYWLQNAGDTAERQLLTDLKIKTIKRMIRKGLGTDFIMVCPKSQCSPGNGKG